MEEVVWQQDQYNIILQRGTPNLFTLRCRNEFRLQYGTENVNDETIKLAIDNLLDVNKRTANGLVND